MVSVAYLRFLYKLKGIKDIIFRKKYSFSELSDLEWSQVVLPEKQGLKKSIILGGVLF